MPKYKSPDGRVFCSMQEARFYFCATDNCFDCAIEKHANEQGETCGHYTDCHPDEAARLMGYEIIEDEKKTCINCKYLTEKDTCTRINTPKKVDPNLGCVMWKPKDELKPDCEQISTESNQEAKADSGKPRPSLVQSALIRADMGVREYGCQKYHKPDNWRNVEASRYWDALLRHVLAAWDDWQAVDPESGLPHLHHIICNAGFLAQYMEEDGGE